jgi:hypothetical protein
VATEVAEAAPAVASRVVTVAVDLDDLRVADTDRRRLRRSDLLTGAIEYDQRVIVPVGEVG